MNIELKPIAESKVRQLGGDVCGVLVRTEGGEVMAVSEHGRCTRLDAGVMGPVEPAGMSDMRDEFEEWFSDNHVKAGETVNLQMKAYMWVGFQAGRAQGGQGAEVAWGSKPSKPGRYVVRGFDSAGTEALVCVAEEEGELVCNLHDYNSDPVERYSNLLSEISDKFQWIELFAQPQPAVPEGFALVPESMCLNYEDIENIITMTGWDEGQDNFGEGVLWVGALKDDDGNETYGLHISCIEVMEEGALPVQEFQKPELSTPTTPQADGWVLMPEELTAENGAKSLLMSEFHEVVELECGACDADDEDCEGCGGNGSYTYRVPVSWPTIKSIYRLAVEKLNRPQPPKEGG